MNSLDERANYLWENGTFINSINYYGNKVGLYSMEGQYWEVFVNEQTNEIVDVKVLDEPKRLALYAQDVDISNLLK